MKSTRLLLFSGLTTLVLTSDPAQAQVVRYRNETSPKLWTVAEVDSFAQIMNKRGKEAGFEFHPRIKQTITRPDTIIYEYVLSGTRTTSAKLEHQQKLSALVGKPLPAFSLPDLQGKLVTSKSLLGKPAVLNLWFTSCGPCLAEMPVLNRVRSEQARTNVAFLALTFESKEKVQAFLQKQPFNYRHLVSAKQYCDQLAVSYPMSIFVDKGGIVRAVLGAIPTKYDVITQSPLGADEKAFYAALKQIE